MGDGNPAQEERIAAQRTRIQKRQSGHDEAGGTTMLPTSDRNVSNSAADRRVSDTRYDLAAARHTHVAAATRIQVSAEAQEAERRQHAQDVKQQLTLMQESDGAEAQHGALNLQFEALYSIGVPHDLHAALEAQRKDCAAVAEVKDKLANELRSQLHEREVAYVRLLQKNKAEVGELVDTMRSITDAYLQAFTTRQAELEKMYEAERKEYLEKCAAEIRDLVKTRRTKDTEYRKRREQKLSEAQSQLEERYEVGYEDFNDAKREHQAGVHGLRAELEKSKADYLLNAERLTYNLQVLRERVKENRNAQAQYKKKIAKLQETLASLLARHQDAEKRFRRANTELAAQLHRADQQYTDTQSKFAVFERKDKQKYKQLWGMHHDKCQALAQECLQADRVVYEELLRVPWQPPALHYWPREEMEVEVEAVKDDTTLSTAPHTAEVELSEAAQMLLSILKSQAPFLVDANVQAAIRAVEGTSDTQADLEGILTTLNLQKTSDVDDMLQYFLVENEDETVALINPQEALKVLAVYLANRKEEEAVAAAAAATAASGKDGTHGSSMLHSQSRTTATPAEERQRLAEKEYWRNMAATVPPEHLQVWDALEDGLSQYLAQLQQRKQLLSETDVLRAMNAELRDLIRQYMQSDINYELYAPPRLVAQGRSAQ